jgi:hypothetical protein
VGEDELKWKSSSGIRVSRLLVLHLATALIHELGHGRARFYGHHDSAVAEAPLLENPEMVRFGTTRIGQGKPTHHFTEVTHPTQH